MKPRLVITLGDLSGIGPELAVKLLANPANLSKAQIYLIASEAEVNNYAQQFQVKVPLAKNGEEFGIELIPSRKADLSIPVGQASLAGGERVKSDLLQALELFKQGTVDSILFLPLNKTALHLAGMNEEDELRWFAKELNFTGFTSELNFIPGLTTSRVTSHCAIKEVPVRINARSVDAAIVLLDQVIRGNGIKNPPIAVCALNPHGGENGKFGTEEIDHIGPGIELAKQKGINVDGPFPSDTAFVRARKGDYCGVVTMYHDQGQIALKTLGFDQGVTVQGGLPVPIATPAHGTAYEIVGKNIASLGPTQRAFDIAVALGNSYQS